MDDAEHWLRLCSVNGLHYARIAPLLDQFGAAGLAKQTYGQLTALGLTPRQAEQLTNADNRLEVVQQWLSRSAEHWFISWDSPHYPPLLREIPDAPLGLFGCGNVQALQAVQLAIVGTRQPTSTGRDIARQLSQEAASLGYCIVSGLARGIDAAAHQGALAASGQTVAVLGHGLQFIYPMQHQALAAQICQHGALISEFWPDQRVRAEFFPIRNRIVVGMAAGALVVEAALQSGSLISARLAMEYNREVFAVPGSIRNPQAAGCHYLIQQGAKLTTQLADILEELPGTIDLKKSIDVIEKNSCDWALSDHPLLANVGDEATAIDLIAERAQLPVADVAIALLELELAGAVHVVPGGYIRVRRA